MKDKIIFITDYFGPNPGGIENFHSGLVKYWYDENLITICFDHNYLVDKKELEEFNHSYNKQLYRFPIENNNFFNYRKVIKNVIPLINHIREYHHIKHIIIGNISLSIKFLINYIKSLDIPYSIILHPVDIEYISFYHFQLNKFINNARYIFTYTNYFHNLALIKGIYEEKLIKIPFGLYIRWNENKQKIRKEFRIFFDQYKTKIKILSVGPLTKKKNLDRIIPIFLKLNSIINTDDIIWFITGSGMEYYYLQEMIKSYQLEKYIQLTGFMNDKEMGYLYFMSDIFFHPGGNSKDPFSGFSSSLLEASFTSLPVVAGNGAAVDDFIQNNVTGFILRYDDYEGIAFKIKELILDSKLRKRIGQFGEQKVINEFSIDRSIYNIYERINII